MDQDDISVNESLDSDAIDEELEHQLYGAIFFGGNSSPILQSDLNSTDSGFKDPLSGHQITATRSLPYHEGKETVTKFQAPDVLTSKPVGTALVSSFKDQSSSECDEGFENEQDGITEIDRFSSTEYTTEESDCESISKYRCERSKPASSTPQRSSDHLAWDAENLVLGVSQQASSRVCNADDSSVIARRLAHSSNDPSMWRINNEDRFMNRSKSSRDRYFHDSHNSVCSKCKKRGHIAMDCNSSGPTCILCGQEGHERDRCNRVYCYACFSPGHFKDNCTLLDCLKRSICKRCGLQGHQAHLCTELWRQYRNTTEPGKPIPIPRKMEVQPGGCCNCGNRGHTVDECRRKPFRSNFLGPPPRRRVLVYDQKDIYKRIKRKIRNASMGDSSASSKQLLAKKKTKAELRKRQKKAISKRADLPRLELPDKQKKDKTKSPAPPTQSDLELSVHQKLFEQILSQQNTSDQRLNDTNATEKTEERPETPVQMEPIPSGFRRRPSMDGAAFLPLDPDSTANRKRQFTAYGRGTPFAQDKRFRRTDQQHFSPFTWINQRTTGVKLNDERVVEKSGNEAVDRLNSQAEFSRIESKKIDKKKKKKKKQLNALEPVARPHSSREALKNTLTDQNVSTSAPTKSKKRHTASTVLSSAKQARMGLQSLLIDPDKPRHSIDTDCSDTRSRDTRKKKKKKKPMPKEKKLQQIEKNACKMEKNVCTDASGNCHRAGSAPRVDWQTFARGPIRIDSWDVDVEPRGAHSANCQTEQGMQAVTSKAKAKSKKNKKRKSMESEIIRLSGIKTTNC